MDLYYKTVGGSVSCCYSDLCNDGSSAVGLYPTKQFSTIVNNPLLGVPSSSSSFAAGVTDDTKAPAALLSHREGNCEKYFEKINSDEWVPDILGAVDKWLLCFGSKIIFTILHQKII